MCNRAVRNSPGNVTRTGSHMYWPERIVSGDASVTPREVASIETMTSSRLVVT
jgi:hypothetical protein